VHLTFINGKSISKLLSVVNKYNHQPFGIAANFNLITLRMQFFLIKNFSYILYDFVTKDAIIIDPAWEIEKVEDALKMNNLKLKAILITHTHYDHINLTGPLVSKFGCQVWVSSLEAECLNIPKTYIHRISSENYFRIGNISIKPLFTPGHSPGSICYLINDTIFTGDTLFIEGCGMCPKEEGAPQKLFNSLLKLKSIVPEDVKVFPAHSFGHLPGKTFRYLLDSNIYLQLKPDQLDMFIAFRMRRGQFQLFNFK
jgi:glyoxylase-like metal-dependent hydrolase (beta-lactamase superfamily II)